MVERTFADRKSWGLWINYNKIQIKVYARILKIAQQLYKLLNVFEQEE
jgi:hypothetical protein